MIPMGYISQASSLESFDVSSSTGFMPPESPCGRLPIEWEAWEVLLDSAICGKLKPGDKLQLSAEERLRSEEWRAIARKLPLLPVTALEGSPLLLRRAHLVLAFLVHLYIQTLPLDADILIPRSLSIPFLKVSKYLDLPPVITYSDTALYNWDLLKPSSSSHIELDNLRCQTLFSDTTDEAAFYLCSARIELRGVEALELMRLIINEINACEPLTTERVTQYLRKMSTVINDLKTLLLDIRKDCDPDIYFNDVRPWLRGEDSDSQKRKWVFEGIDEYPDLTPPSELSGASAAQSSLIHALDVFLGIESRRSHSPNTIPFLQRMQKYMPRKHRLFLDHLSSTARSVRDFVMQSEDQGLLEAYNASVLALKEFRDAHMIITTLYIVVPARKAEGGLLTTDVNGPPSLVVVENEIIGTGGTELSKFLKGVRDETARTLILDS